MNCFKHKEAPANGICKACNKAVCGQCALDTGNGIACSEKCEKEVHDINMIVDRSKQIYSIGSKPNAVPSGILVYVFFTVIFLGWSGFEYLSESKINEFLIIMGIGFGIMGVIMYRRIKKLNINC